MSTTETRYVCRHIFTDGRRCQSPTLRGAAGREPFCYYHHTTRRPIPTMELARRRTHRACREPFRLPNLEDRAAIQQAISEVVQKIALNEIDPKRAGLLLFGLQTASKNLPKQDLPPTPLVDEITYDATLGLLAPEAEVGTTREKGAVQLLLEQLDREKAEREAEKVDAESENDYFFPSIQASRSPLKPKHLRHLRKNRGRGPLAQLLRNREDEKRRAKTHAKGR